MILAVIDSQSKRNYGEDIPGSISGGSMYVAFKLVLQRQERTAEVYEQSVLKMHDHSSVEVEYGGTNG